MSAAPEGKSAMNRFLTLLALLGLLAATLVWLGQRRIAAVYAGQFITRVGKDKPQGECYGRLVVDRQNLEKCVHRLFRNSIVCTDGGSIWHSLPTQKGVKRVKRRVKRVKRVKGLQGLHFKRSAVPRFPPKHERNSRARPSPADFYHGFTVSKPIRSCG